MEYEIRNNDVTNVTSFGLQIEPPCNQGVEERIRAAVAEEREACARVGDDAAAHLRRLAATSGVGENGARVFRAAATNAEQFAATVRART